MDIVIIIITHDPLMDGGSQRMSILFFCDSSFQKTVTIFHGFFLRHIYFFASKKVIPPGLVTNEFFRRGEQRDGRGSFLKKGANFG